MAQRVFIVWHYPLFLETLRRLLIHPAIDLLGDAQGVELATSPIHALQPTLIIYEDYQSHEKTADTILSLLDDCEWRPRIMRLSLDDNQLRIYQGDSQIIDTQHDLIDYLI